MSAQSTKSEVYLTYNETREVIRERDPNEMYSGEDVICTFTPKSLYKTRPKKFIVEEIEVPKEYLNNTLLLLIYAEYSTGDTFGRTDGVWKILGIKNNLKEAEALEKYWLSDECKEHKPWEGYFEHLIGIEIKGISLYD